MKTKTLATALTVSLPMILGAAYAQTTTDAQTGTNRSASGNVTATTPPAASSGGPVAAPGTEPEANTGASGADSASGTTGTATTGTTTGTGSGTSAATGASPAGDAGMQSNSAASTEAITGWSANDDIIGKSVYNENDEKIGDVNDVVISSDGQNLYLVIGAGGFLGMGEKDVAIPFDRLKRTDDRILLTGYTKEQLKTLPEVRRP